MSTGSSRATSPPLRSYSHHIILTLTSGVIMPSSCYYAIPSFNFIFTVVFSSRIWSFHFHIHICNFYCILCFLSQPHRPSVHICYRNTITFWINKGQLGALLLEKAMAPHSSTLAWKIPWMEEPGRLQSLGSLRVRHD